MFARVTLLEIDLIRTDLDSAFEVFRRDTLPALHEREGFRGVYVLATPEGRGLLMSLWDTAEAADASSNNPHYMEALVEHTALFKAPPGRERYEVMFAEAPALDIDAHRT